MKRRLLKALLLSCFVPLTLTGCSNKNANKEENIPIVQEKEDTRIENKNTDLAIDSIKTVIDNQSSDKEDINNKPVGHKTKDIKPGDLPYIDADLGRSEEAPLNQTENQTKKDI